MLIYVLLKGFFVLFNWALLLFNLLATTILPQTMPSAWLSGFSTIAPLWNQAQSFFPINEFLLIAQLMVGVEVVLYLFNRVLWLLKKIPFIGG